MEEHLEEVLRQASILRDLSLKEEGNINYQVYQSEENFKKLILIEEYISEDAIRQHIESEHYKEIAVKNIHPYLLERKNDLQIKF
ncbi:putative quinol monooxygenase [Sphingobacterium bovistauri]|uniref:Antibiotic biosynthesis monooxygenase n=1 Tax=Sphingobacterium bovistauri TaxID=2781959 RepID=A0ABS7ZAX2_9SPHI|nr:antibiotic biosynthesis monooxygenase [Sphingobacterium bovistauri]MCA5006737.1 antibiotic biosynthesis monooxygenase [Sphingobacterium bovistauri]